MEPDKQKEMQAVGQPAVQAEVVPPQPPAVTEVDPVAASVQPLLTSDTVPDIAPSPSPEPTPGPIDAVGAQGSGGPKIAQLPVATSVLPALFIGLSVVVLALAVLAYAFL